MTKTGSPIDFYFDFISPFSYLAIARMDQCGLSRQCEVNWIPVNLPRLIKLSGNVPPASIQNKARYLVRDLKRQAEKLGCPLHLWMPGSFDSRAALAMACSMTGEPRRHFARAVFHAIWTGKVDMKQTDWLRSVGEQYEWPCEWESLDNARSRGILQSNTEALFKAGGFGVPSFITRRAGRRELYFGLDHVTDVQQQAIATGEARSA